MIRRHSPLTHFDRPEVPHRIYRAVATQTIEKLLDENYALRNGHPRQRIRRSVLVMALEALYKARSARRYMRRG